MSQARRFPRLEAPTCPVCTTPAEGVLVPVGLHLEVVEHTKLRGPDFHDVRVCWKCLPCDRIFCAVKVLRQAA